MRAVILGALVALVAGQAGAQVTRCGMEFGKWVCRADPQRPDPNAIFDAGQRAYDQAYARTQQAFDQARANREAQAEADLAAERRRAEARGIVRSYIANGQCDDAGRVAREYFGESGYQEATQKCLARRSSEQTPPARP